MINISKETVKKLKDIDHKAENILKNAEKDAENLISQARYESPGIIKTSREERDHKKAEEIDKAKRIIKEQSEEFIDKGRKKIHDKEEKVEEKLDAAADIAVDMFIRKIKKLAAKDE